MPPLDINPKNVVINRDGKLVCVAGPLGVEAYRLNTLIAGLKLEGKTGLRLSGHRSMLSLAKQTTGLKTNDREAHIQKLKEMVDEKLSHCVIVDANEEQIK